MACPLRASISSYALYLYCFNCALFTFNCWMLA